MAGALEGRVVIVTGAGRGIGAEAVLDDEMIESMKAKIGVDLRIERSVCRASPAETETP